MKSRKAELKNEGWVRRTTIDELKLSEIVGNYERLGFEVRLEPVNLDGVNKLCQKCYEGKVDKFKTIYVRRRC